MTHERNNGMRYIERNDDPPDDSRGLLPEEDEIMGILEETDITQENTDRVMRLVDKIKDDFMQQVDDEGAMTRREIILGDIRMERIRQIEKCKHGGDTNAFDHTNSPNDFIAYITTYAGRAAQRVKSNKERGEDYRINIIKVAALCVAAIEEYDRP